LTSYITTYHYDGLVLSLLRRMTHLEKLALYLRIGSRNTFVDGKDLYNEILVYMAQLDEFIFYISTECTINSTHPKSIDIQQTLTHIKYKQAACIIDYHSTFKAICQIYSLPFTFTRLKKITNNFPNIVFDTVTHLHAYDVIPMEHEFFMRISQAFPLLKYFSLQNDEMQRRFNNRLKPADILSYSIIKYPHLISLNLMYVHIDYVGQFLLETKTHLPSLTQLAVNYNQLKTVTMNFTRDVTRRNCSNIKQLLPVEQSEAFSNIFYEYFPLL
jgi:hypothetical protein